MYVKMVAYWVEEYPTILSYSMKNKFIDACRAIKRCIFRVLRYRKMPRSTLSGEANLLVFPNLDAANITLNVVKQMTDALHVGPVLLGTALPAHILTPSVTSRGVVNMAALAVVGAEKLAQANAR